MPVTLRELAKASGFSVATVSRVLNNREHPVSEETRQRILSLAKEMGYIPNWVGRSLRTDRTFTVGLIVDNICSPFSPIIIRGIQDHLKPFGYFGIVINADFDPSEETRAVKEMISRSIDGAIFIESSLSGNSPALDMENKPYVFVHRLLGSSLQNTVAVDDRCGAQLAVDHLVGLGHRRIAFINGPPNWYPSTHRMEGYRDTLEKRRLPYDPDLVIEGDWEVQGGYRAARRLLALPQPQAPTAIFAANDLMALGAIFAVQEAGMRVPEDMAVVGYDNRDITLLSVPRITTVALPCYEMGQTSAKIILDILEGRIESADPVQIRGKLMVRESCGATREKLSFENYTTQLSPPQLTRRSLYSE